LSLSKTLRLALEDRGHELNLAFDGKSGLDKVGANPDLILLDIMLPDLSGIEILKKIKANKTTQDIPVIIMTNLADQGTISKIMAAGGKDYFVKSDWPLDDLVKKIEAKI
jgi:two-component system alkaline phosphatase synthesis response regulator PhoP